ncbi:hypothetical protein MA16_Dca013562 [Dendrobium catenatum]|uniref:Uncharacterized protein n=1 Tax=Dendrobium catenatum TaxID=906689 RepID=A0A2I0VPT5_9ASPA|nr:hypothetical protein MA16_Dca013562 [Dendrobium catenatum]
MTSLLPIRSMAPPLAFPLGPLFTIHESESSLASQPPHTPPLMLFPFQMHISSAKCNSLIRSSPS